MKKTATLLMVLLLSFGLLGAVPLAAAAGDRPKIEDIEYKGSGKVEVDFFGKVSYQKPKVTVKDTGGKAYKAKIYDRDSDEVDFRVSGIAAGKTYKFTISGIKARGASAYGKVTGRFKVPSANKVSIKEVSYDAEDGELSVEFDRRVSYKNPKATLTDAAGKSLPARIVGKDRDEVELRVSGLTLGQKYTIKISGIKAQGGSSYTTAKKTFTAWDD